ncbi:homoserine kinase [Roseateles toxinivorans]|uniref:Homoserine kinase n=1 Tax=Roseateles toxinivorans TaxID=270368 RepID=A0A4R6QHE7_9BURK|nr:homoserine kinase [Roseateles toxinivorans]TDP62133.1 homoserine kinase [Roseateles toxinivorans]
MAVFTEVTREQASQLAAELRLGALTDLRGIKAGIENTNYFLTTEAGEWVLTVFERLTFEELPFYLQLMKHLARHGIPVPDPQANARGEILLSVAGKPAAVVNKLAGGHQLAPDLFHCEQLGAMLARMHLAAQDFELYQPNLRGLPWWTGTVPVVLPHVTAEQAELLSSELAYQQTLAASATYAELPRGPIHADLFRDNAMFEGLPGREQLTGFFDFYFAGVDAWLFDVAVCINDWCIDLVTGRLDEARAQVLVNAYAKVRPLNGAEYRLLPALLRAAALRFWISRLWDFHLPRDAALLKPHDPGHFERVLRERVARPWHALQN